MYKTGIIGTGRIAWLLEQDPLRLKPCTHAGALIKMKKFRITAAADPDQERLQKFAVRYKVPAVYPDYREMLKKESLDLVIIASWTGTHKEIVIAAARQKIPVILCEKPLAVSSADGARMVQECKKNDSVLVINHERRYDPLYTAVKKILAEKKLGKIRTVYANVLTCRSGEKRKFQLRTSSLLHDGTHLLDTLLYFFGRPLNIKGYISRTRTDTAYAVMTFPDDIIVFLEAGGERNYFNFELDIQGMDGRIRIGNEYRDLWLKKKSGRYKGFEELYPVKFPVISKQNHFIRLYQDILAILEKKKKIPVSSGLDGLYVLQIINKII